MQMLYYELERQRLGPTLKMRCRSRCLAMAARQRGQLNALKRAPYACKTNVRWNRAITADRYSREAVAVSKALRNCAEEERK